MIPVDGAAVDQGRKLSESLPEDVSNGTHHQDDVEEVSALVHEHVKERHQRPVCLLQPV